MDHSHRVLNEIEVFVNCIQGVQLESQRYVLLADPQALERWREKSGRAQDSLGRLKALTSDNGAQLGLLAEIAPLVADEVTLTQKRHQVRQSEGLEPAIAVARKGEVRIVVNHIQEIVEAMRRAETILLRQRTEEMQASADGTGWLVIATCAAACAICLGAISFIRRDFHRLDHADRALRDSAARVRDLYNNAPCGYHSLDANGVFTEVNDTELAWLGYSRDELVGKKRFRDLAPPASQELFKARYPGFVRDGRIDNLEFEMVKRDGTASTMLVNAVATKDPAGNLVSVRATLYDITQRKKAEEERDRFFNLTRDLLCVAGFDGYFKRLNPAWEEALGYSLEELMSKPLREWIHPDDHPRNTAEASRQFMGHDTVNFENRYRCKDGSYRWFRWSARSLVAERLIYASARDITDEKRVEQIHLEFRALFESLPGLYLVLKPDLTIVAASDAYLAATKTKRTEILGRGIFEVFPDNPADKDANGVSNLRGSLERVRQHRASDTMAIQRYDVRGPDGTFGEKFWSPVNSPVVGADQRLQYIIHRVEDVTEFILKKRVEGNAPLDLRADMERMEAEIFQSSQQVQAANQQLHAVNQELEAFSYSVSHDLRAPLRHIDGFAGLLAKQAQSLDEKSKRYVTVISEAARQMGRLIDDLLAFSRINRSHLNVTEVDFNTLVSTVITEGRYQRPDQVGISWSVGALPRVQGDPAMLRQVWANLVDNAVKYSGKKPNPRIEIGFNRGASGMEYEFFIRDNGAGFDMRYADKLFGVFQRLHGPAEFEGTGIGLANVRRIILRHGGHTRAEGQVDEGATFFFTLPAITETVAMTENSSVPATLPGN